MAVNRALEQGDEEQTLQALQNEQLDLSDVYPLNKSYYHSGLLARSSAKTEVRRGGEEGEGGGGGKDRSC